jgi:uncharacterized membrane protein YeiH
MTIDEDTLMEALGAVFFAVLTGCGEGTVRDCADTLSGALEAGAVGDPAARDILRTIVRSARVAERLRA